MDWKKGIKAMRTVSETAVRVCRDVWTTAAKVALRKVKEQQWGEKTRHRDERRGEWRSLREAEIKRHKQFLALFAIPGWQDWSEEKVLAWGQARKAAARLRDAKVRETKRSLDSNKQKDKEARAKEMERRKVMMESWLGVRRSNTGLSSSSVGIPADGIG
jgi:hypothetical protein